MSGPQRPRFLSASGFDAVAVSIGGMAPTVAMNLNPQQPAEHVGRAVPLVFALCTVMLMLVVTLMQFALSTWILNGRLRLDMLWREPVFAAAALGVTASLTQATVWAPLMTACKLLGDISLGLMIFSLGVRLSSASLGAWRVGVVGAVVTPLTGMLVAWAFGALAGLPRIDQDILFIFGALPPAVSSFIFAERYQQEPDKVASIVMIGNAAALFFIPLALAIRL